MSDLDDLVDDARITAEDIRQDLVDTTRRLQDVSSNPGGLETILQQFIPRMEENLDLLQVLVMQAADAYDDGAY